MLLKYRLRNVSHFVLRRWVNNLLSLTTMKTSKLSLTGPLWGKSTIHRWQVDSPTKAQWCGTWRGKCFHAIMRCYKAETLMCGIYIFNHWPRADDLAIPASRKLTFDRVETGATLYRVDIGLANGHYSDVIMSAMATHYFSLFHIGRFVGHKQASATWSDPAGTCSFVHVLAIWLLPTNDFMVDKDR